jgi:hypothetical protein
LLWQVEFDDTWAELLAACAEKQIDEERVIQLQEALGM